MFEIKVDVNIPLVFQNVEGKTMFEAAENVRTLIEDGLSVICVTNQEQIKKTNDYFGKRYKRCLNA